MTKALRWVLRRLLIAAGVLFGAATVAFVAMQLIPGDAARAIVGAAPASDETMAEIRSEMGLDLPWPVRFLQYLARLAVGDLGRSYQLQQPVSEVIGSQLWFTVELALAAAALAILGALVVATLTAGRWRPARTAARGLELLAVSTPPFWLGVLLLTFFSFRLGWFPLDAAAGIPALVLPALTLAIPLGAVLTQVLREALEQALEQPFVVTARARGVSELRLRFRHTLRHALIPLITLSGWMLGGLLGGAVLVETVFARPGLGRITLAAVTSRDFPVVIAVVMVSALVFVVVNTAMDGLYRIVDPRLGSNA